MKPAEIKKRARRLAKEGKVVDAIRALETLTSADVVDPYDLVMMADLCVRAGRTDDAIAAYERAVEAYRDASLHRNGIALCKRVLRAHPDETRFTLHLGELCELEGLVPDAVGAYLEYAEPLDPDTSGGKPAWLGSLCSLTPRNTKLLTRQSELLVRWERAAEAVAVLRRAAEGATSEEQRATLTEIAGQITELGGAFEEAGAELSGELPRPEFESGVEKNAKRPGDGTFDHSYLSDLSFDDIDETPSAIAALPTPVAEPGEDTVAPSLEAMAAELEAAVGEPEAVPEEPSLTLRPVSSSGGVVLDAGGIAGGAEHAGIEGALEDLASPLDALEAPRSADAGPDDLASIRQTLEAKLEADPFDLAALEKLVEVCTEQGDSLTVLDLRERLAQACLTEGRPESALDQLREILEKDPSREDLRAQHDRLAAELGRSAAGGDSGGEQPDTLFNVRGLSKVEVRDDPPSSEDDMVDLGALLDEFRNGLDASMAGESPRAHYDIGLSHMEMGLLDEAAAAFEFATASRELEPEAREMWGRCLRLLNRDEESIDVLRAALGRRPGSLGIRYQLGLSLESAGEANEAVRLFQSIVRDDPNYEDTQERIAALGGSGCTAGHEENSS